MIVRELVQIIGFRINEAQYASVEARVRQLGSMMTFMTTLPIVLLGKSFVEAANNMQQFNLALETYADNTGQAQRVSKELQDLALGMPTAQIEDLSEATSNMLARGIPMEDLVDTFRTFYVITGATGGNMKGLTKAYTDSLGKGKLAGQEFNQFINASVPLNKALKEFTGKSAATLKQMQKEGKITFEVLRGALKNLAKEGSQFSNMMEKKAMTLWGLWKKLNDWWFLLKVQLGNVEMKGLTKLVEIFTNIIKFIKTLDGNWKRFIVILMGVSAVVGPLLLIWSILKMFAGPIGYVTAAIGIISVLIDDIYVWVNKGDSIMGALFGDYEQYKPAIQELKQSLINIFTNLKNLVKEVLVDVIELFALFTGKKEGEDLKFLSKVLWFLNKIATVISTMLIGARELFGLLSIPFKTTEENKKTAQDLRKDIEKNPITSRGAAIGSGIATFMNDFASMIANIPSAVRDVYSDPKGGLSFMSPSIDYSRRMAGQAPGFGMFPMATPTLNLTVNAPGADTASLVPAIKAAVDDSFRNAARNIKNNMAEH